LFLSHSAYHRLPGRSVLSVAFAIALALELLNPPLPEGGDSWLRPPPGAALREVLRHRHQPG
jgi:hypothetical protein